MLMELTVPSAPDASFFQVGPRPLRYLNVDAGYDTQGFIRNLAHNTSFSQLRTLEFGEYNETYLENWRDQCTPFADFEAMLASPASSNLRRFVWRNPACSSEEVSGLKRLRPELQLLIIHATQEYIATQE